MDLWLGRTLFIIFLGVLIVGCSVAQFWWINEQIRAIRKVWKKRKSWRNQ